MARIPYDVSDVPTVERRHTWPIFRSGRSQDRSEWDWPMYSADELGQFPPIEWLIPSWLAREELTGLYGPGDTFKFFIALEWALSLAAEGLPVVYIAAEGFRGLQARIALRARLTATGPGRRGYYR